MNRADANRLADLRDMNDLAELEILTSRPEDLPRRFEAGDLTVAQMIIVSELVTGITSVANSARARNEAASDSDRDRLSNLFARLAEKRAETPYGVPADSGDDDAEAERQAAFAKLFTDGGPLSDDPDINTVNGPVRLSAVPKTADGNIDPDWVEANCACPEHTEKREAQADRARALSGDGYSIPDRPGLYV